MDRFARNCKLVIVQHVRGSNDSCPWDCLQVRIESGANVADRCVILPVYVKLVLDPSSSFLTSTAHSPMGSGRGDAAQLRARIRWIGSQKDGLACRVQVGGL
mmetsp:Transcript_37272/g.99234  ORF Transcript_37272/g.99234 Transcript_37272/m.99234 type:complete len:102 (-) Transcript_37272:178-483(-)